LPKNLPEDNYIFYYHPDHLGSTGYMTDRWGRIAEHLQYTPWGETWVEQRRGPDVLPMYQFTGKELDPETNLYYYGARYYDPQTSVWQSADPAILEKGQEYLINEKNISIYTYCNNNPLILVDPDGKIVAIARFKTEASGRSWLQNLVQNYKFSYAAKQWENNIKKYSNEKVVVKEVRTGQEFIAFLKEAAKADPEKGVTGMILVGHAGGEGMYGATSEFNGFQLNANPQKGGATPKDLLSSEIQINPKVFVMLLGCNTAKLWRNPETGKYERLPITDILFNVLKSNVSGFEGSVTGNLSKVGDNYKESLYLGDAKILFVPPKEITGDKKGKK
jgi:RHS repeat-associated protein